MEAWLAVLIVVLCLIYLWGALWYLSGINQEKQNSTREHLENIVDNTNKCWGVVNILVWIILLPAILLVFIMMILTVIVKLLLVCVTCGRIPWDDERESTLTIIGHVYLS